MIGFQIFVFIMLFPALRSVQLHIQDVKNGSVPRAERGPEGQRKDSAPPARANMSRGDSADLEFKPRFILEPGQWIRNGVKVGPFKPGRPGARAERYVCGPDVEDTAGDCLAVQKSGSISIPISCARVCR